MNINNKRLPLQKLSFAKQPYEPSLWSRYTWKLEIHNRQSKIERRKPKSPKSRVKHQEPIERFLRTKPQHQSKSSSNRENPKQILARITKNTLQFQQLQLENFKTTDELQPQRRNTESKYQIEPNPRVSTTNQNEATPSTTNQNPQQDPANYTTTTRGTTTISKEEPQTTTTTKTEYN